MLTRLPDGTRVVIRSIRPEDKDSLAKAVGRLSPESSRQRFLVIKPSLTASELRYLTEVDGERHVAFVAVLAERPNVLVAVGRYVRLPEDPTIAEVAIVVGDELQRQGLGSRLGFLLADHARAHGIARFTATMLSDNVAAHRLFAKISERLAGTTQAGLDELVAELAAA
jgi:RimJ/RimL family protein N-acetyltransferase